MMPRQPRAHPRYNRRGQQGPPQHFVQQPLPAQPLRVQDQAADYEYYQQLNAMAVQVDYYFSPINLREDEDLHHYLIHGAVPLAVLADLPRIRRLGGTPDYLRYAIQWYSRHVVLTPNWNAVLPIAPDAHRFYQGPPHMFRDDAQVFVSEEEEEEEELEELPVPVQDHQPATPTVTPTSFDSTVLEETYPNEPCWDSILLINLAEKYTPQHVRNWVGHHVQGSIPNFYVAREDVNIRMLFNKAEDTVRVFSFVQQKPFLSGEMIRIELSSSSYPTNSPPQQMPSPQNQPMLPQGIVCIPPFLRSPLQPYHHEAPIPPAIVAQHVLPAHVFSPMPYMDSPYNDVHDDGFDGDQSSFAESYDSVGFSTPRKTNVSPKNYVSDFHLDAGKQQPSSDTSTEDELPSRMEEIVKRELQHLQQQQHLDRPKHQRKNHPDPQSHEQTTQTSKQLRRRMAGRIKSAKLEIEASKNANKIKEKVKETEVKQSAVPTTKEPDEAKKQEGDKTVESTKGDSKAVVAEAVEKSTADHDVADKNAANNEKLDQDKSQADPKPVEQPTAPETKSSPNQLSQKAEELVVEQDFVEFLKEAEPKKARGEASKEKTNHDSFRSVASEDKEKATNEVSRSPFSYAKAVKRGAGGKKRTGKSSKNNKKNQSKQG